MNFENVYNKYKVYLSMKLKPTTFLFVDRSFRKHIIPFFHNKNINEITIEDIIKWQNYITNLNYSNSFNNNLQAMFKKFYDYMETLYDIKNLMKNNILIKNFSPKEKKELNVWTIRDYKKFIKKVDDKVYRTLFNLLFFTGLRKGEALALRFSDIDLENKKISINKSITTQLFDNKHLELKPKTKSSIRKISIGNKLYKELFKLKEYYKKIYINYNDDFYIFGGIKSLAATTLERKKNYYCDIAKVKQIRIHDFRHSHATLLYNKKISPKTIQARLGHASITTTIDTYIHENYKQEKKVLRALSFLRFKI